MKYLKHASKILAKTHEKHLKTITNIRNIQIKHLQHMCETYATPDKHTCDMHLKNTDETLVIDLYNIRVQPLQHMQHPDILLQHPSKTFATCFWNTWNIRLQHAFSTLFFRMTQSRVGNGQPVAEDGGTARQRPATNAPRLGAASDDPNTVQGSGLRI